jgi:hypothetical protein
MISSAAGARMMRFDAGMANLHGVGKGVWESARPRRRYGGSVMTTFIS